MNWLAHVFLSEPDTEVQLGNLLADVVKGRDRDGMSAGFLRGVKQHQAVDVFTDSHPIVHRSQARMRAEYGLTAGILVDIFYDHFLARSWDRYSSEPLEGFTTRLYAAIRGHPLRLPQETQTMLDRLMREDWLGSYRTMAGIETALGRVSRRLEARIGKRFGLERAVSELCESFDELAGDFAEFFPVLQAHVAKRTQGEARVAADSPERRPPHPG
jgi:acyl carrier protein phosphodiesterase